MSDFDHLQPRDAFFSKRIRAGKRTYYFDVKATRGNDYYITITESKRKPGESEDRPFFEKHKLFLYKEDFEKFTEGLHEALDYIREKRSGETTSSTPYQEGGNQSYLQEEHTHQSDFSQQESAPVEIENEHQVEASTRSSFTDLNFEDLEKH